MAHEIKSFLHGLLEKLNNEQDFVKAQQVTLDYIKESRINDEDRRRMLVQVQYQIFNTQKLYQYLYNAMLRYEGLGTIGRKTNGNMQHMGIKTLRGGRD